MTNKRHRDRDVVQKAGTMARERGSFWHRILARKGGREQPVVPTDAPPVVSSTSTSRPVPGGPPGDASVNSSRDSDQATKYEYSHSNQSLWDQAYEALGKQYPDLVTKYQNLLENEAQAMGTQHLRVVS
jgi:hypothetical protein